MKTSEAKAAFLRFLDHIDGIPGWKIEVAGYSMAKCNPFAYKITTPRGSIVRVADHFQSLSYNGWILANAMSVPTEKLISYIDTHLEILTPWEDNSRPWQRDRDLVPYTDSFKRRFSKLQVSKP